MSTQAIAASTATPKRGLLVLLFAGFVLTGVAITLTGPILPVFIARWSLSDSQAGFFSTVEFAASLGGVWLSSLLTHYFGYRPSIVFGYFLMGAGLAFLNAQSLTVALIAAAALGIGYGMAVPGTNLSVAEMGGARSASLVSLLNLSWGVGAVSCSPLVMLALKLHFLPQLLAAFATLGGLVTLLLLFTAFPSEEHGQANSASREEIRQTVLFVTIALASLFFLYVGTEVSFSFWAATYAKRLGTGAADMSTLAPMFFFGGLMTGRALAPLALARIRENRLVLGALAVTATGAILLVLFPRQKIAFASLALAGLGCSCIFPIFVAWLSRWYGARARRLSGLMFSMSSVGASAVPWFVGFVSTHAGGLRIGMLVPLVSAALMIVLLLLLRRQTAA